VGSSYIWSNNLTSKAILVTSSGKYFVEITSVNGCKFYDTVVVILNSLVQPNLGIDRAVCDGVLLNSYQNGSSYLWSTAETSATINATTSALY